MRIIEVRAKTVSDGTTGWAGKFASYQVHYYSGDIKYFKKPTAAVKRFIENKAPKHIKSRVNYPHYVAIWKPEKERRE
ncbi:MAG: hypothetical protein K2H90_01375 [Oscillospiraceae bacterium]|nr:hypothetical protein [Oscillospiraceae bacterium]